MLLRDTFSDEIANDHQTRGDTCSNLKRREVSCTELRDRLNHRKGASHCSFRVILVSLRVACNPR